MNNPADEDAAARAVRQAVDALAGDQPRVHDWPLGIRRAVARRRRRRATAVAAAVAAIAVISVGSAATLGQRGDALVAAPAQRDAPTNATLTPTPSGSDAAADRRCEPRPQPASRSSLQTSITFPATPVRRGMSGTLTVRNGGATAVSITDREYLPTATAEGEFLTSAYAITADGVPAVPLEPGQERSFRVSVSGWVCEPGKPNSGKEIGAGRYQLVALIPVPYEQLASEPIEIVYEP